MGTAQIPLILRIGTVLIELLLSVGTFYGIQWFCKRTAKIMVNQQECAGVYRRFMSAYAWLEHAYIVCIRGGSFFIAIVIAKLS